MLIFRYSSEEESFVVITRSFASAQDDTDFIWNVIYYIYILRSIKDKNLYVGHTNNLRKRFIEHSAGKVKSTMKRIPLKLVYCEPYKDRKSAKNREWFFKKTPSGGILKKKLAKSFTEIELKYYLNQLKKLG